MSDMVGKSEGAGGEVGSAAMILAAGLGTRMRPLTETTPKPLVRLAGRAMLDHTVDRLKTSGVGRVVVNVHHLADQVERHVAALSGLDVAISDERDLLLDTGGGLARALPELGQNAFFVLNSDSVWIERHIPLLDRLRLNWRDDEMDCLLALCPTGDALGFSGPGDFTCDPSGLLARRVEDTAPYVNTGIYLAHPRIFRDIPEGPFSMNLLWDRAIEQGRLYGLEFDGLWMHVGTPDALVDAEQRLAELSAGRP